MEVTVGRGRSFEGRIAVPGDKSIAHRWLLLAATARGTAELLDLPSALDVRSTARVCGALLRGASAARLEG